MLFFHYQHAAEDMIKCWHPPTYPHIRTPHQSAIKISGQRSNTELAAMLTEATATSEPPEDFSFQQSYALGYSPQRAVKRTPSSSVFGFVKTGTEIRIEGGDGSALYAPSFIDVRGA